MTRRKGQAGRHPIKPGADLRSGSSAYIPAMPACEGGLGAPGGQYTQRVFGSPAERRVPHSRGLAMECH